MGVRIISLGEKLALDRSLLGGLCLPLGLVCVEGVIVPGWGRTGTLPLPRVLCKELTIKT
jgi:hypothetical protein